MTKRVFTRRRHAVRSSRLTVRAAVWLGFPIAVAVYLFERMEAPGLPVIGLATLIAVLVVWSLSVFRTYDLTGEWRFF
jgi:membrane protein YdbS with pleckstrin-like domain